MRLTADFYKKVDRQAVLDGARTSMIEYLKKHNVANASLPQLHATADDESNAEALHREVSDRGHRVRVEADAGRVHLAVVADHVRGDRRRARRR